MKVIFGMVSRIFNADNGRAWTVYLQYHILKELHVQLATKQGHITHS